MQIKTIRIRNYKGFSDSGDIELSPGMNVIVGQNNSGKTALMEAIGQFPHGARPHRSLNEASTRAHDPLSYITYKILLTGDELKEELLTRRNRILLQLPGSNWSTDQVRAFFEEDFFKRQSIETNLSFSAGGGWSTDLSSVIRLTDGNNPYAQIMPSGSKLIYEGTTTSSVGDGFLEHLSSILRKSIYIFKAERLNISACAIGTSDQLASDASNLPSVLLRLSSINPHTYRRYQEAVRKVFPWLQHVSAVPSDQNAQLAEIKLWSHSLETERSDIAIPLADSGTGVGQVLAILYVVYASTGPRVVVIDEPNSFLHPGAAKKLVSILSEHGQNQFVVSTHSTEIIRVSKCERLVKIYSEKGKSHYEDLNADDLRSIQALMAELGVKLSDVFGADAILWVEGVTEELVIGKLVPHFSKQLTKTFSVVPLRNVGDVVARRASATASVQIYERLSSSNALIPPTIAFCLDGEGRTKQEQDEIRKRTNARVEFLPRRTLENYLLIPLGIAKLLNETLTFRYSPIDVADVERWLRENGGRAKFHAHDQWKNDHADTEWLVTVDGAELLSTLFSDISSAREEYRKATHSVRLTEIVLEIEPQALSGLIQHFERILI